MSGTKAGCKKGVATIRKKYGRNWYKNIGRIGGRNGNTGGFASDKIGEDGLTGRERAVIAGAKGGSISRRTDYRKYY